MKKPDIKKRKIGLVLSGGGAQGAYQAGVIKALFEAQIPFSIISGASIGALNGLLTAQQRILELEQIWLNLARMKLIGLNSIPRFIFSQNISLLGDQIQRDLVEKYIDLNYLRTKATELVTTAVSLQTGAITYFSTKRIKNDELLKSMLIASCAIPGIFPPVQINGQQYIDGGLLNNTPLSPLLSKKLTDIVAISMEPTHFDDEPISHIGDVALRSTSIFFKTQVLRAEQEWKTQKNRQITYNRLRDGVAELISNDKTAILRRGRNKKILADIDAAFRKELTPVPDLHLIRPKHNLIIQQYDFDVKRIPYTFEVGYLDGQNFVKTKGKKLLPKI